MRPAETHTDTALQSRRTPPWFAEAACTSIGGDFWYPDTKEESLWAKKICSTCPVAQQCLDYALEIEDNHGIWGGMVPNERRRFQQSSASAQAEEAAA